MALFGRKKKEEDKKVAAPVASGAKAAAVAKAPKAAPSSAGKLGIDAGAVLLRPRITEKAGLLSEGGVYAFDVAPSATKAEVAQAVAKVFNVHPVKVRMVSVMAKKVMTRGTGKAGRKSGGKKAYVELKEGEKIELI